MSKKIKKQPLETLIDKCVNVINNNPERKERFYLRGMSWSTVIESEKVSNMLYFLSRTPDGEAVMPFLDVLLPKNYRILAPSGCKLIYDDTTLDHLLYREFAEALRVGKTFDEAYKITNLIYLQNV